MKKIHLSSLLELIVGEYIVVGDKDVYIEGVSSIFDCVPSTLTWIRKELPLGYTLERSLSSVFVVPVGFDGCHGKTFIQVKDPEATIKKLIKAFFIKARPLPEIHSTAIISPEAEIATDVSIGAYCVIGSCKIGSGVTVENFSKIHDGVEIGSNVLISDHCNIGGTGFSHTLNINKKLENFPHVGRVVIESDVEIFPFVNIDRAGLSVTRVGKGSKIDHYCHLGHNTTIGENVVLTARVVLCGGAKVRDRCWVGVGAIIRDGVTIFEDSTIGMGSVVTKDIPAKELWVGNPACKLEIFNKRRRAINSIIY